MKATIYFKAPMGIGKAEGVITKVEPKMLSYLPKRGRRERAIMTYYSPWMMVVPGWGKPDPDDIWEAAETSAEGVTVQRGRYRAMDPRWVTDFMEGAGSALRPVVLYEDGQLKYNKSGITTTREATMLKIASPQQLQNELRRLLAYCESDQPSRERLAAELRELAGRVAARKPSEDPAYRGKDVTRWSQSEHNKRVEALTKKSMGDLMGLQSLVKVEIDQAKKKDPKSMPKLSLIEMHIETAIKRKKKEKKA